MAICIVFVVWNYKNYPWHSLAAVTGLIVASTFHLSLKPQEANDFYAGINRNNKLDMVFYGVLKNSTDPRITLQILGLNPDCSKYAGLSAYMFDDQKITECTEHESIAHQQLFKLAIKEPKTIALTLIDGIKSYKGVYIFMDFLFPQTAKQLAPRLYGTSISRFIVESDRIHYFAATAFTTVLCIFAAVYSRIRERTYCLWATLAWLGGFVCFYSIFSAVFGDGMVEVERHAAAVLTGLIIFGCACFFGICQALRATQNKLHSEYKKRSSGLRKIAELPF